MLHYISEQLRYLLIFCCIQNASSNTFSISLLMLHVHQLARYAVRQLCDISFSLRSISYLIREICWLKINQFPCQVIKKLMKGLTIDDTDNWGDLVCHKRAVVLITQLSLSIIKRVYSIWMRLLVHSSEQKQCNLERRFRYAERGDKFRREQS